MYKAFISYNRSDREFARQLQRRLEAYVVPKTVELTELHGRLKRPLHPIFRDEDEMTGAGRLSDRLRQALAKSEYLIVICSPAAANPDGWVDKEVREFLDTHGPDQILPIAIAGEPDAVRRGRDAAEECLPPSLLQFFETPANQILWVDMRRERKDRAAFLRVVAALLSIDSLDQLIRRDSQRQRIRRRIFAAAAALLLAVIAGLTVNGFYQRSVAQEEAATVALSRARNALLAGRANEGFTILRDAHRAGIRGNVAEALIDMASWLPTSEDVRAAPDNPMVLRRGENFSILHASGRQVAIAANPERILYTHDFSRAIVYGAGRLETFSLVEGRKLASRDIGLVLRPNAPVIASPTGTFALGLINEAGVLREQRSYLVFVNNAGAISEPMSTHLEELDGVRDENNIIHLGTVPIIQGDCRYLGFLRPEAASARWSPGAEMQASIGDFAFFELAAEGLRRMPAAPQAAQYHGVVPAGVLPFSPAILPDGPEGPATGTNLDQLNTYCDGRLSRDLNGTALPDSIVQIGTNADREPRGWWVTDTAPSPGGSYPFEQVEQNPCIARRCVIVGGAPRAADGTPLETGWEFFSWFRGPVPRGTTERNVRFLRASQVSGQFGHEEAICRMPATGDLNCALFPGSDAAGPGFAGEAISADGSLVFAAGPDRERGPGFSLLRLAEGRQIEVRLHDAPAYAGELADFSADGRLLFTLDSRGTISVHAIGDTSITVNATSSTSFVPAFDVYAVGLDEERTRAQPIPTGLRYVADDAVFVIRRDGGVALLSARTGREIWQSRIRGIGPLDSLTLSPDRRTAMIRGSSGARLLNTATGMPVSGIFGYPAGVIVTSGSPDIWVADDRRARIGNVARLSRPRSASVEEAMSRLEAYFGS